MYVVFECEAQVFQHLITFLLCHSNHKNFIRVSLTLMPQENHSKSDARTQVLELGSSSTTKFSRHLVVHLPNDAIFRNTSHAGSFVSDLLASHDTMFWVKSSRDDQTVRFVDESVYSRNRAFRMFLCSKRMYLFFL